MYKDKLRLRLPKGVLPYLEAVDELLLLTQIHQRKGTKQSNFREKKTTNNAPANSINQTSETNSYT